MSHQIGVINGNWDGVLKAPVIKVVDVELSESIRVETRPVWEELVVLDEGVERNPKTNKEYSKVRGPMVELGPLQGILILVDNVTFFEVDVGISVDRWCLHKWLVYEVRVISVALNSQKSIQRSTQKVWMSESVCDVRSPVLVWDGYIELVTLVSVEIGINWSIISLFLPFLDIRGLLKVHLPVI